MLVEPFTIVLALLPLIGYLLVLAIIRLSGNVLVTTGSRDIAALGVAISGLLAVGPAELFFPAHAATLFGPLVWIALGTFYGLCVALVALTSTPRLVAYGRTPDELFGPLLQAARNIDPASTGDSGSLLITLPSIGIHLRIDGQRGVDYGQVMAFESGVSIRFWTTLLAHFRAQVRQSPTPMPRRGLVMLLATLVLGSILVWQGFGNQELVVEGFRDWLWR